MEIWLKKNNFGAQLTLLNNSNQSIEALKAGIVDVVIMDGEQGSVFSHKTPGLSYTTIAKSTDGYGIAFAMHSPLKPKVNEILRQLSASGELNQLKLKWLGVNHG
jgi:polar amino acid transport system substrate-binding protein